MEQILQRYRRALEMTPTHFVRYLDSQINWNSKVVSILGARGIGKTTLMRQHIKMYEDIDTTLYVDAGDVYFADHSLIHLAERFYKDGGKKLYIDEIHRYKNWSAEVKMMYDFIDDFKVVYSGSSILDLEKGGADLSRRKTQYYLAGLSFREFLKLRHGIDSRVYTMEEILTSNQSPIPSEQRPISLFKEYLKIGYYPYSSESDFIDHLMGAVNTTLEVDIPQFANMTLSTVKKIRKLFYMISQSVPFQPNISQLATALSYGRGDLPELLEYLDRTHLTRSLTLSAKGLKRVSSPEKILMDNTTLAYTFANESPNIGTLRETAFCQMVAPVTNIEASAQTDFKVGEYSFEVGGKNKGTQQISGLKNAYVVRDDTEYRSLNFVPLWHFGFLY